jgi:hypothetical protein
MNKGFIFGGDSFVWGEGLDLFSNCPKIKNILQTKDSSYDGSTKISEESFEFQEKNRFPTLVANHFNTFSSVFDRNGGDNYSCLDELIYLIRNNNLNKIGYVIYQPTSVWRSCNIVQHPIMTTFGAPAEISLFKTNKQYPRLGNGNGFKKYNIDINKYQLSDFFKCIENSLIILLEIAIAWESNWNTSEKIKDYIRESVDAYPNIEDEIGNNIDTWYDFTLTEFSDYGKTALEIQENIEKKLIIDCIDFIKTQIISNLDGFGHPKFLFLETWNTEVSTWKNISDDWYHKNCITLSDTWHDVSQYYEIAQLSKYEFTHNLHPSPEGHQWFANQIINYLEK